MLVEVHVTQKDIFSYEFNIDTCTCSYKYILIVAICEELSHVMDSFFESVLIPVKIFDNNNVSDLH